MAETPYLRQFGVARVVFLTETPGARIWKATLRDGRLAALKIYRGATMRSEASGVAYMLARSAAVDIYRTNRFAILMEWLEGPSLGDLARDGKDEQAARELGAVAQRLMAEPIPGTYGTLPQMFDLLLRLSVPQGVGAAEMRRAQALADCLLADGVAQVPLHGDLHHDNVRQGPGGWTAFDAKGLVGDPAFELANAFRNPKGMAHADPGRI